MLDLSKLESGRTDWRIEPVDLRDVVATSAQAAAQLFRDKGVALDLHLPERVPPVAADRDRVVQVVVNLLSNAVKFSAPGAGRVARRPGARGRHGPGGRVATTVPASRAQDQQVIFEKFRQGGDTRRNRPAGTGLGPADQPGDRRPPRRAAVGAEHARGGRDLLLYTPDGHRRQRRRRCGDGGLMPRKVLIVDDEPNIVTSLHFLMKKSGFETSVARDGDEALTEVERFRPDLVLLDVMMPKRDGFEVCQKLRAAGQTSSRSSC